MNYLSWSAEKNSAAIVKQAVTALKKGRVLVLPTDTIYGFSCLADREAAIKKIYHLKNRSVAKPLIILVSGLEMAKRFVYISASQAEHLRRAWLKGSRPTTFILRSRGVLPPLLSAFSPTLAVRLPKSKFLIRILKELKKPLVSTSLNLSGQEDIFNLSDLELYWPHKSRQPDLIIDAGPLPRRRPSRLIDLTAADGPKILRN